MTDTPGTSSADPSEPTGIQAALRDVRWLTAAVWLGLVAAMLVTSIYGITAFTEGSIATRYLALPSNVMADNTSTTGLSHRVAVAGLVASGLAAAAIAIGWYQLARATRALIIAYSSEDGSPVTAPVAAEWVSGDESNESTVVGARIPVVDVLLFAGAAWAILILTPAFLNAVSSF